MAWWGRREGEGRGGEEGKVRQQEVHSLRRGERGVMCRVRGMPHMGE